jgi:hypothetical protein
MLSRSQFYARRALRIIVGLLLVLAIVAFSAPIESFRYGEIFARIAATFIGVFSLGGSWRYSRYRYETGDATMEAPPGATGRLGPVFRVLAGVLSPLLVVVGGLLAVSTARDGERGLAVAGVVVVILGVALGISSATGTDVFSALGWKHDEPTPPK